MAASLVTCVAGIAPSASAETAGRDEPLIDRRVVVHGARLHVRCVGQGATTVVLIAGFSDGGEGGGPVEVFEVVGGIRLSGAVLEEAARGLGAVVGHRAERAEPGDRAGVDQEQATDLLREQ